MTCRATIASSRRSWSEMDERECGWHGSTAANRHGEFRTPTATILDSVVTEKSCFGYAKEIPQRCTESWRMANVARRIAQVTGTVFGPVSPDGEWLSSIGSDNSTGDDALNQWPGFASAPPVLAVEPVALEPGREARLPVDPVRPGLRIWRRPNVRAAARTGLGPSAHPGRRFPNGSRGRRAARRRGSSLRRSRSWTNAFRLRLLTHHDDPEPLSDSTSVS